MDYSAPGERDDLELALRALAAQVIELEMSLCLALDPEGWRHPASASERLFEEGGDPSFVEVVKRLEQRLLAS
ncbi:hypothetical protein [Rathayibacter sp. PhB151]|uniref:hypothetical protein n=1 Tax=Rathayibacter sp. PhB151 TaxID=2485189 RepID=UPI0010627CC6|nr:hypothetical protein [Rathayibacter sp. PhB151]